MTALVALRPVAIERAAAATPAPCTHAHELLPETVKASAQAKVNEPGSGQR